MMKICICDDAETQRKVLIADSREGASYICISDILYIMSAGNYVKIICSDNEQYLPYGSMTELSGILEIPIGRKFHSEFCRIYKDYSCKN